MAARGDKGDVKNDDDESSDAIPKKKKPKKTKGKSAHPKKKSKGNVLNTHKAESHSAAGQESMDGDAPQSDWQYGKIRALHINNHRNKGCSYKEACKFWDDSVEKAQLLSLVPLPELKKRRFVGREVTVNPWLEKLGATT